MIKAIRLLQEHQEDGGDQEGTAAGDSDDSSDDKDGDYERFRDSLNTGDVVQQEEGQFLNRDAELNRELTALGKKRGRCFRYGMSFLPSPKCLHQNVCLNICESIGTVGF